MKNRIIVNTRSLHGFAAGSQRYTQEIVRRLGNHVEMITPPFPMHGIEGHFWEQTILPLKTVNGLLWSPSNTGPLAVKNQVVSILDMSAVEHPEWFSSNFSFWYRFLLPKLAQRVNRILTISEFSRERICEICDIDRDKVVVTNLGVDQKFYNMPVKDVQLSRKKLGISAERYILGLGSLEPRKNLGRLLKAWSKIQNELPDDLWLVLAGAKGKASVFRDDFSLKNLPPKVYLTGYVLDEHLPALYSGAEAFVYPSLYEGFGLPPLEAMSCGTPVIASNTTSLPEVVLDAGLLVDPLDIDEIASAIKTLIENKPLNAKLCQKGLERAKLFSWDKTAALTLQVLTSVNSQ